MTTLSNALKFSNSYLLREGAKLPTICTGALPTNIKYFVNIDESGILPFLVGANSFLSPPPGSGLSVQNPSIPVLEATVNTLVAIEPFMVFPLTINGDVAIDISSINTLMQQVIMDSNILLAASGTGVPLESLNYHPWGTDVGALSAAMNNYAGNLIGIINSQIDSCSDAIIFGR